MVTTIYKGSQLISVEEHYIQFRNDLKITKTVSQLNYQLVWAFC